MQRAAAGMAVLVLVLHAGDVQAGIWPSSFAPQPLSAAAAPQAPQQPHPAVVRVIAPEAGGTSYGSGTLVDVRGDYGLVLTNWHVVADATHTIEVVFPDGFRTAARLISTDRVWDLAALAIWKPNVEPVSLATSPPRPGEPLTIAGYGSGTYRAVTGRCTQYVAPAMNQPYEMVELSVAARQGDSGGPIFNSRGELAGVLWGAGWGTTAGSYSGRVGAFVAGVMPAGDLSGETQLAAAPPGNRASAPAAESSQLVRAEYAAPLAPLARTPSQVVSQRTTNASASIARADNGSSARPAVSSARTASGGAARGNVAAPGVVDEIELFLAVVGGVALALQCLRLVMPAG